MCFALEFTYFIIFLFLSVIWLQYDLYPRTANVEYFRMLIEANERKLVLSFSAFSQLDTTLDGLQFDEMNWFYSRTEKNLFCI